jgi:hypothetical protein
MFKNKNLSWATRLGALALAMGLAVTSASVEAGARDQAKRMYDRIAGVPPTDGELAQMLAIMDPDEDNVTNSDALAREAAAIALESPSFYNVTLKNLFTPWSNEEQTVFADLNDFTATLIGLVRDGDDFRKALHDDVLYVGNGNGLPAYSSANNDHYVALENSGADLGDEDVLVRTSQSYLPSSATAGVMTTRQGAKAYFVAGTNRAMLRFTMMNFLCLDLEQVKDTTRTPDRIRQDVSRSPGGDSRLFMNNCVGCHAGMDPLAQAFAYYNWSGEEGTDEGEIVYTPNSVQPKYLINADTFRYGYATPNDQWDNYWREGQNSALGWDNGLPAGGQGAKSMGMELAHTEAFAQCQVQHVFKTVCLHAPTTVGDIAQVSSMVSNFKNGYNLQNVFTDAAAYCRGD